MVRKSNIFVLCLLSFVLCLTSCRPKGILHSWEMRRVLVDLHKTDALLQVTGQYHIPTEEKAIYYAQVLQKHGITQAEFDSSLVWYTAHPQLFDKIYPKVLNDLKAEEEAFLAQYSEELALIDQGQPVETTPVIEFRKAQLDSILWVTQHGYPSTWNPLVHDLEDELFPQICVSRGGVVDSLQTSVDVP